MSSLPPNTRGGRVQAAAPVGPDVVLVLTDIEGSTSLWERAPEAMAEAVLTHHALVREHLGTRGGYEIKSEGDAFALAFSDARQALAWAMDLQERLALEPWSAALREAGARQGLRVRVGVHVGRPIRHPDPVTGRVDYLGPAMNRAARVAAAGHGGQVLLSDAAWRAVEPRLGDLRVEVEDLGLYTLRGLPDPERLRLARRLGQGARRSPPLRAARFRPTSALAGRDLFVGRAGDLAEIRRLLGETRLLTLKGTGGTGKTRLACRYGAEQEADWPGGVVFCDLAEARTGEAVLAAVARALELSASAGDAEVGAALSGRGRTLLILDNLEQVAEQAAPRIAAWLEARGESAILATSRSAVGVPGERVMTVGPLSLPPEDARLPEELLASEAAQLYVERAGEHGLPLTLGPQTCEDVAALVRRLDGLPLAIELAAAWSRLYGPAGTLARVREHLGLLARESEGRAPRQATLGGVVAWSWDLLTPWEQAAFAQFSVFEGGAGVDLAAAVIALEGWPEAPPPLRVLERLVEHSLLRRDDQRPRLITLATLQDFAAERLAERPEARAAAERRHRDAMLALLERAGAEGRDPVHQPALRLERQNLLVAARRAVAARDPRGVSELGGAAVALLCSTGPLSEALALARARRTCPGLDTLQRARVTLDLGEVLRNLGQPGEARVHLEDALELASEAGDPATRVACLLAVGVLEHDLRRFDAARARYEEALELAGALPRSALQVRILQCLGHLERETGAHERAERHLRRALALCPEEDRAQHLRALSALALLQLERGSVSEAARTLREVVTLASAAGDRMLEIVARGNLAEALLEQGRLEEALGASQRAVTRVRAMGSRRLLAINLGNQGDILLRLGRLEEAERALEEAIELSALLGLRDALGAFRGVLGTLLAERGQLDRAWEELEEGASELGAVNNLLELLRVRLRQIRVARRAGRPSGPLLEQAEALASAIRLGPRAPLRRELAALAAD